MMLLRNSVRARARLRQRASPPLPPPSRKKAHHGRKRKKVTELCSICFVTEKPVNNFRTSLCKHRFCLSCLVKHIQYKLQEHQLPIRCAEVDCSQPLIHEACKRFLPAETFDAWTKALMEQEIPAEQRIYCPFRDCSQLLVKIGPHPRALRIQGSRKRVDPDSIGKAECPFCDRLFCAACGVPWHAGLRCSAYQTLPPDQRSEEDLQLFKLAHNRKWQRCFNCKHMIERIEGCNHMRCRCGYFFCYRCGAQFCEHLGNNL